MTRDIGQLETSALLDGRYQLHERVGIGGMAEVFRAEDVLLGRTVAIKLMRADADVLAAPVRAQREVSALTSVTDPSLVTLFEAKIGPDAPRYLVMEFVDGPTLAQRLHGGALPMPQVRRLALELAGGLHAVHSAGFVHRDIKPSNILLAPAPMPAAEFHVKLADFGLAQLTDAAAATTPGLVLGTAAYLSPEQVRGEACGPAADIYAFGLVLLEAISGERAFPDASGIGAVIARLVESPAIPAGLDPEWSDLLRSMTATDPTERPSALDIVHALASGANARAAAPTTAPTAATAAALAPLAAAPLTPSVAPQTFRRAAAGHRRRRRMSRPLILTASVAAAGVVCASAMLTGLAFPANGAPPAQSSSVEQVVRGTLPGAGTGGTAEEPLTIDTVDAPASDAPLEADTASVETANSPTADKDAAKAAREAQKQQEAAARAAEQQAAADQREADKAARAAAKHAGKNRP